MIQVSPNLVEQFQRTDPNHPLNRSFYENLPVPDVHSPYGPGYVTGPQASPHLAPPPAANWNAPSGSSVQPGAQPMPPAEDEEQWVPQQQPPVAPNAPAPPLPTIPPDEPGAGDGAARMPWRDAPALPFPATADAGPRVRPADYGRDLQMPSGVGPAGFLAPQGDPGLEALGPPPSTLPPAPTQPSAQAPRLMMPQAPPAMLQQPLGAPLYQSPGR
jgi:hypothetical protein